MNIISNELLEGLKTRYMSNWYEEINHNENIFIFKCIGEGQWNVFKNGTLLDTYSFHYYDNEKLSRALSAILK